MIEFSIKAMCGLDPVDDADKIKSVKTLVKDLTRQIHHTLMLLDAEGRPPRIGIEFGDSFLAPEVIDLWANSEEESDDSE